MRGETIVATIRRLRLQRAADHLSNTNMNIAIVASRAGYYSSLDTFRRAFKEAYRIAPISYRLTGSHAVYKAAIHANDAKILPVTIEELSNRRCAGVNHTGSYMEIDHVIGKLFTELASHNQLPARPQMLGLFYSDPEVGLEKDLRSCACIEMSDVAAIGAPLVETIIQGGLYAKLHYKGPYHDMRNTYKWFLGVWLPASG